MKDIKQVNYRTTIGVVCPEFSITIIKETFLENYELVIYDPSGDLIISYAYDSKPKVIEAAIAGCNQKIDNLKAIISQLEIIK